MSIPATVNLRQAADPTKTAGLTRYDATCRPLPFSHEGRIVDWLCGVAGDRRITVLHRLVLIKLGLHRCGDSGRCERGFDTVAGEIGVDRTAVLRALDVGARFGWLANFPGRLPIAFTFPIPRNLHTAQGGQSAAIKARGAA